MLSAAGGAQALERARQAANLDLLLTDMVMPRMNGLELIAQLRKDHAELPVLLATGFNARLLEAPLPRRTTVLLKPFGRDALLAAVRDAVAPPCASRGSGAPRAAVAATEAPSAMMGG